MNKIQKTKIVVDIETTGPDEKKDDIGQIAIIILDENNKIINAINRYYPSSKSPYYNTRYFSQKTTGKFKSFNEDEELKEIILQSSEIIGHNIHHDISLLRLSNIIPFFNIKMFCTMRKYKDIIKIPMSNSSDYKFPTLRELMLFLKVNSEDIIKLARDIFKADAYGKLTFHNAMFDVTATYIAYVYYIEKYQI